MSTKQTIEVPPNMPEEISSLLKSGQETIVRDWTEKVTADRRINSDARLSYVQLIDHVPQIVEELRQALAGDTPPGGTLLQEGEEHGRQRWQQGYELKEVVRELTLLRATLMEFLEKYRAALPAQRPEQLAGFYYKINGFMDEEIYKTVEAYLDAPRHYVKRGGETFPASSNN
ncbi:MAG: RsbRD N-terminal domain-containing protein [Acidobacteria bacterium]|nr:RsbRD N-terminal domain-containing protein [Acidobacteriota bacterium]